VREDHRDDLGLLDAGADPERPVAALQVSISMPNTRFNRFAEFIATRRGGCGPRLLRADDRCV
jgi:hypothetical protein